MMTPEIMAKLMKDPEAVKLFNDPSFKTKMAMMQQNPNAMMQMMNDPQIQQFMGYLMGGMGINPNDNNDMGGNDLNNNDMQDIENPRDNKKEDPKIEEIDFKKDATAWKEKGNAH